MHVVYSLEADVRKFSSDDKESVSTGNTDEGKAPAPLV